MGFFFVFKLGLKGHCARFRGIYLQNMAEIEHAIHRYVFISLVCNHLEIRIAAFSFPYNEQIVWTEAIMLNQHLSTVVQN